MADFVVITVKLDKNPAHDPRNKVTGICPLAHPSLPAQCTDVTGEHHSYVMGTDGMTLNDIKLDLEAQGIHVTRIEEVL